MEIKELMLTKNNHSSTRPRASFGTTACKPALSTKPLCLPTGPFQGRCKKPTVWRVFRRTHPGCPTALLSLTTARLRALWLLPAPVDGFWGEGVLPFLKIYSILIHKNCTDCLVIGQHVCLIHTHLTDTMFKSGTAWLWFGTMATFLKMLPCPDRECQCLSTASPKETKLT